MERQQRFQHKVGSSRSRPQALEGSAALLFMPCRPPLHKVERPHCICNMQTLLALLPGHSHLPLHLCEPCVAAFQALRSFQSHQCYMMSHLAVTMTSIWPFRQRTSIAQSWQSAASTVKRSSSVWHHEQLRRITQPTSSSEEVSTFQKTTFSQTANGELTSVPSGRVAVVVVGNMSQCEADCL